MPGPRAIDHLLIEELDGEGLVYDLGAHRAHSLSPLGLAVLRALDGRRGPRRIAADLGTGEAEVAATLAELRGAGLLRRERIDRGRRRALGRLALGAVAAAPVVFSIIAPRVAEAASSVMCVSPGNCTKGGDCCGTSGSPARICNGQGICVNAGQGSRCQNALCQ